MSNKKSVASRCIACATAAVLLLCSMILLPAAAEEAMLADLLPSNDSQRGNLSLTGCTLRENDDGSVTFKLTSTSASFKMIFAENFYSEGGGSVYNDMPIDLSQPAFVVYDYASADGVALGAVIAHYTRKDKATANTLADLYLVSMESPTYAQYSKISGTGYGIWDWGTYVAGDSNKIFADNIHRFCDIEGSFTGTIGAEITFYSFYVSSTHEIEGLGSVRPVAVGEESSEEPPESSDDSEEDASDISEEDDSTEGSDSDISPEESEDESKADDSSQAVSEPANDESDGTKPMVYILVIAGALIVIGAAAFFITKRKK